MDYLLLSQCWRPLHLKTQWCRCQPTILTALSTALWNTRSWTPCTTRPTTGAHTHWEELLPSTLTLESSQPICLPTRTLLVATSCCRSWHLTMKTNHSTTPWLWRWSSSHVLTGHSTWAQTLHRQLTSFSNQHSDWPVRSPCVLQSWLTGLVDDILSGNLCHFADVCEGHDSGFFTYLCKIFVSPLRKYIR